MLHANGDGVEAVDVLLDGKKVAVTDGDGAYSIKAKQGMHDIQVRVYSEINYCCPATKSTATAGLITELLLLD